MEKKNFLKKKVTAIAKKNSLKKNECKMKFLKKFFKKKCFLYLGSKI